MTLLLDNPDVAAVLTPAIARETLMIAYQDLAAGEAVCRPRIDIRIPTRDPASIFQWGTMEGGSTRGYFAIRIKSDIVVEQEHDGVRTQEKYCGRPGRYLGMILLIDVESGLPLAIVKDGHLQHMRVAADSAIGTALMARPEASVLGMLGAGGMARTHVAALTEVRNIDTIRVWSPTSENRRAFAREMEDAHGIATIAVDDPRDAYRGADILAACTDSTRPVIRGAWLEPGMHVLSIGGPPDDVALARFDRTLRLGTAPAPVGRPELATTDEYLGYLARPDAPRWAKLKGGRRARQVTGRGSDVMYGAIANGAAVGRTRADEITYSERGNIQGAQFFAVAGAVYEAARERGIGRELPTEWFLQDIRN